MAVVRYPIKLNVKPSPYPLIKNIALVQNDTANVFAIELQNNKEPFNIKDCYVTATFKKSDKNVVVSEGNIIDEANGLVDVPILLQAVAYPGKAYCTIEVYNKDKLRLTSIMFEFTVVEELGNNEDITSFTEYTILQELITDVQSIKVEEEQRVINENTRMQNEIDRQTVFNGIVDTANTTKDGLDASIVNADNIKFALDNSIVDGNSTKVNLDTSINNAKPLIVDLNANISEGNQLKLDLPPIINDSNTSKTNLEVIIDNANLSKTNLDDSIDTAITKKTGLDKSVTNAEIINDTLSNVTTGTIKKATDIDTTLSGNISTAITKDSDLKATIVNANTSKSNLDTSITNSGTAKSNLDGSINEAKSVQYKIDDMVKDIETVNPFIETFVATEGQQEFILTKGQYKKIEMTTVYIQGISIDPIVDFILVDDEFKNKIYINEPLPIGTEVKIHVLQTLPVESDSSGLIIP